MPNFEDDLDDEDDIYANKQDKFKQRLQAKYQENPNQQSNSPSENIMPQFIERAQKYFEIITEEIMKESLGIP